MSVQDEFISIRNDPKSMIYNVTVQQKTTEPTSLKRWVIFVVIVIVAITVIIIPIVTVTVVFVQRSQHEPQYQISNHDRLTTASLINYYEIGSGGDSGAWPCTSHTVINDPTRNMNTLGIGAPCDNGLFFNTTIGGRWIRFTGSGGTTIPNSSPGFNRCGAYMAGWSNSSPPAMYNSTIHGFACFDSIVAACIYSVRISIINCNSFFVYFLPELLVCNARYCTT